MQSENLERRRQLLQSSNVEFATKSKAEPAKRHAKNARNERVILEIRNTVKQMNAVLHHDASN